MAACAHRAIPDAVIDVVVGGLAEYRAPTAPWAVLHRDMHDLSPLMCDADIAVSAAGTTLYELCAVGLPTVAVPIVENQLENTEGFEASQLGLVCPMGDFEDALEENLRLLALDETLRSAQSQHMRKSVDGAGASRIARELTAGIRVRN